jgi:RNA polymerase sigma factor (sigma-70 family)
MKQSFTTTELYNLYKTDVEIQVKRILRHYWEDACQDTWIKIDKNIAKINADGNPKAYILRTATNTAIDECRRQTKVKLTDEFPTLSTEDVNQEMKQEQLQMIEQLNSKFEIILNTNELKTMKLHNEEYTNEEIAAALGESEAYVRKQKFNAIKKIKKTLSVTTKK